MLKYAFISFVLLAHAANCFARDRVELINRSDGKFVVRVNSCEPALLVGLDINSQNGILIPFDSADPFAVELSNTHNSIVLGNRSPISIAGEIVLDPAGPGGWDRSRPEQYDTTLTVGGFGGVTGWVPSKFCGTTHNTIDFGRVIAGDTSAGLLIEAMNIDAFRLSVVGATTSYHLSSFQIERLGAEAFDVLNFEPFGDSAASLDVSFDVNGAPGVYEAAVTFFGTQSTTIVVPGAEPSEQPYEEHLFNLCAELIVFGDCDFNGDVDSLDLACVTTIPERDAVLSILDTLPGDLDGNGDVSFADFLVLSTNFGMDLPGYTDGNIDLEGSIAFPDFLVLSANFGKTPDRGSAVPEANGMIAFCLGLLSMVALRSRRKSPLRPWVHVHHLDGSAAFASSGI